MIHITNVQIEPNPVETGQEISVEIEVKEVYKDAKRYWNKYPHRYMGDSRAEGYRYPYKYARK